MSSSEREVVLHTPFIERKWEVKRSYRGSRLSQPLALLGVAFCSPIMLLNSGLALLKREQIIRQAATDTEASPHPTSIEFSCGLLRGSAALLMVARGQLALCGISPETQLTAQQLSALKRQYQVDTALLDAALLHAKTGLAVQDSYALLQQQLQGGVADYLKLCLKGLFCSLFYRHKSAQHHALNSESRLPLFGLTLDNQTMPQAVAWVTSDDAGKGCEIGVFVNAHSINLAAKNPPLLNAIRQADRVFADGSGMRVASQAAGFHLHSNLNGTDMLPPICDSAQQQQRGIFMLGAKPGVAAKAAQKLQQTYPELQISGVLDGYFSDADSEQVIQQINHSGADILLLALGSPRQEQWLLKHRKALKCSRALAVGGLFDYFSGNIPRAPIWMRELGLEWIWRLMQEPKVKFVRYVLGTPLFLIRVYLLKQHIRGV